MFITLKQEEDKRRSEITLPDEDRQPNQKVISTFNVLLKTGNDIEQSVICNPRNPADERQIYQFSLD